MGLGMDQMGLSVRSYHHDSLLYGIKYTYFGKRFLMAIKAIYIGFTHLSRKER